MKQDPDALSGYIFNLKENLSDGFKFPFDLIPLTNPPSKRLTDVAEDFTFKERPTGNISHDAFQERGRLSKETLSWHQQMLNGNFGGYIDWGIRSKVNAIPV